MTTDQLYRVCKADFPKLEELLTECFLNDPLYASFIPDEHMRKKLMPKLFECDLREFYHSCEFYADSPDINAAIIVSDEAEPYNLLLYYFDEWMSSLKTDGYLLREDPSGNLLRNFEKGRHYLDSSWTDHLKNENRIHVIYFAVRPSMQHHGLSDKLIRPVLRYADAHQMLVSLETHNEYNLAIYRHFGFEVCERVVGFPGLVQYCLVRSPEQPAREPDARRALSHARIHPMTEPVKPEQTAPGVR